MTSIIEAIITSSTQTMTFGPNLTQNSIYITSTTDKELTTAITSNFVSDQTKILSTLVSFNTKETTQLVLTSQTSTFENSITSNEIETNLTKILKLIYDLNNTFSLIEMFQDENLIELIKSNYDINDCLTNCSNKGFCRLSAN